MSSNQHALNLSFHHSPSAKRRRKSKPRKKEVQPVEDIGDVDDDLWNKTIDDETIDNEKDDPTYATNEKELEEGTSHGTSKRLRRRMKRENGDTQYIDGRLTDEERKVDDIIDDLTVTKNSDEKREADGEEQWEAIAGHF